MSVFAYQVDETGVIDRNYDDALQRLGSMPRLVDTEPEEVALARLRTAEPTGRPLGSDDFVRRLEDLVQRRFTSTEAGTKGQSAGGLGRSFRRRASAIG